MSLHVAVGCMFAGKSTRALTEVSRNVSIGRSVLVVTHMTDAVRAGAHVLRTHDNATHTCLSAERLMSITELPAYRDAALLVVEEAQFFTDLKDFCVLAVERDQKEVRVYGLDGNYLRQPFGQLAQLLPLCDTFEKITALCQLCCNGTAGIHTLHHRATAMAASGIEPGGGETYMPLCRRHYLRQMQGAQGFPHEALV